MKRTLGRLLHVGQDSAWGLIDQGLYAGTNFLAVIVVARVLGPESFGAFALVLAVWATIWTLSRSIIAEPFIIKAASLEVREWRTEARHAAGSLALAGVAVGASIALAAVLLLSGDLAPTLLVLAVFVPVLMLQDFWRVAAFSKGRGGLALLNDGAWAFVQIAAFATLWAFDAFTAPTALAAWALGGVAGWVVGQAQFQVIPSFGRETIVWAREIFKIGGWFGGARAMQAATIQLSLVIVGSIAGLAAVGGLRSVSALFGPLGMLLRGIELSALPAMARIDAASVSKVVRRYVVAQAVLGLAYVSMFVVGGGGLLTFAYGESFSQYGNLLLPIAIANVLLLAVAPLALGLRRLLRTRTVFGIESGVSILNVALVTVFTAAFGVVGAASAPVAGQVVRGGAMVWALFGHPANVPALGQQPQPVPYSVPEAPR